MLDLIFSPALAVGIVRGGGGGKVDTILNTYSTHGTPLMLMILGHTVTMLTHTHAP
jgi:hypothetical protein